MSELDLVEKINSFGLNTFVDNITTFLSLIPFLITLWLVCCLIAYFYDKKRGKIVFISVFLAIVLHFAISEGIFKHLLPTIINIPIRIRPWMISETISPLGKNYIDSSFPSSHMASTLAALTVLGYYYRRAIPYAVLFILLMAFSRIHNGMHYASDILAGTILGLAYGGLSIYLVNKFIKNRSVKNS